MRLALLVVVLVANARAQVAPSEERMQLAAKLAIAMNLSKTVEGSLDLLDGSMRKTLPQMLMQSIPQLDQLTARQRAAFEKGAAEIVAKSVAGMIAEIKKSMNFGQETADLASPLYASQFSAEELKAMIAFYESPAGRHMVESTPELQRQMMDAMQKSLMPKLMEVIGRVSRRQQEELKLDGEKLLEEVKKQQ